jgi:hypothetical protein
MGRLGKRNQNLLPYECLEGTAFGGEQASSVHGGILMIHARRDGEREGEGVTGDPDVGVNRHA